MSTLLELRRRSLINNLLPKEYRRARYIRSTNSIDNLSLCRVILRYPQVSTDDLRIIGRLSDWIYNGRSNGEYAFNTRFLLMKATGSLLSSTIGNNSYHDLTNVGSIEEFTNGMLDFELRNGFFIKNGIKYNLKTGEGILIDYLTLFQYSTLSVHYIEIWNKTSVIARYLPAVRIIDDEPGFYDVINHTFTVNDLSGNLIAG